MRAYVAVEDREGELLDELGHAGARVTERHGRLVLADSGPKRAAWACNVWHEPQRIEISSISEAAAALTAKQPAWSHFSQAHHRRGQLIQAALPPVSTEPLIFGERRQRPRLGSWTLLEPGILLASAHCSSPFPNGELSFVEDPRPPSRAYLKLWELFTVTGRQPRPGDSCLDLGSSPGGWSWVLGMLGARVTSVDKAPLHARVRRMPNVQVLCKSAFAIDPSTHPRVDWLFSDVICYPERLLEYVERWIAADTAKHFVCSLKFQAETDHEVARRFARIPGSNLAHLSHNKHELTWWRFG